MSYIGSSPKVKRTRYIPQSSDPVNPSEGDFFYSNGTPRPEGLWVYTNGAWTLSGSQTCLGATNYIINNGALSDTSGWATYADAAGDAPVDGTGGSPNVTWQRSNQPLRGTHSFLYAKDGANRQGQGVSYDFGPLDLADSAGSKQLWVSFDYYTGDDITDLLQVYVYDVSNSALVTVYSDNNAILLSAPNANRFSGYFQTTEGADDYRLIIHTRGTSAVAKSVYFDNFAVSPDQTQPSAIITEWVSFTPTGSWSTNSTYTGRYRRVGDSMECRVNIALAGAPTAASLSINLPTGLTIDTAKLVQTTAGAGTIGHGNALDAGTANYPLFVDYNNTTSVLVYAGNSASTYTTNNNVTNTVPITFGNTDAVDVFFKVPISGWSPTVALSTTDALFQTSRGQYTGDPASATAGNPIIFPTKTFEVGAGSYSTSTGLYTTVKSGYYRLSGSVLSVTGNIALNAYVNTTSTVALGYTDSNGEGTFTGIVYASAGQTLSLRPGNTLDLQSGSVLNIEYLPDFSSFSLYPNVEVLTATSSQKTPTATDRYHQLTGNTLSLTPGVWRLQANAAFDSSGGASYTEVALAFYSANGADTNTAPAALSAASGLTILSVQQATNNTGMVVSGNQFRMSTSVYIVRVTANVNVFPVSYATMTTAANARITVYGNAERVK